MCQKNVSAINGIAFVLLVAATLMCALSFSAPFWIYYPERHGVPKITEQIDEFQPLMKYPFSLASWRGLWAVCFKEPNDRGHVTEDVSLCAWFWQKDSALWKTIPNWYLAAEGVFGVALLLLLLAVVFETMFACCHCCLRRSCAPASVASFTIAAALMTVTSLASFGGFSRQEGEFAPEPSGKGGRLDWAYFVGVGGAAAALVSAILFYCDGCRLASTYHDYNPPSDKPA